MYFACSNEDGGEGGEDLGAIVDISPTGKRQIRRFAKQ